MLHVRMCALHAYLSVYLPALYAALSACMSHLPVGMVNRLSVYSSVGLPAALSVFV